MFIFETIYHSKSQKIYFSNKIQSIWNFSHNRYHSKAHFKVDDDIIEVFKRSWLQELEANTFILRKSKFNMRDIIKVHYEKFYVLFVLNNLKKLFHYKYAKTPDNLTLGIFVKLLEEICRTLKVSCFKIKLVAFFTVLKKILKKFFKEK